VAPTAYDDAMAELDWIERAGWPARGQVARHYEAAVEVLRQYLETAEEIPARERTSEELLWALPPHLSDSGGREALRDALDEADLVKFASFRPGNDAATLFLDRCRTLVEHWHAAVGATAVGNALR
jgi:hypothetical protein